MTTRCAPASAVALLSVAELLRRAGDGDRAAWEEMMRCFRGVVFRTVRSFRLQDADAHDAMQTTWLRFVENCHQIQFPENLDCWLATVASRECLRILRNSEHTPNQNSTAVETVVDPAVGPEQHVINMDTAQTLRDLVAELAPRKRILLRALFADELSPYAEVSRVTGIPSGSIGPTRARVLRQLRQKLDENQLGWAV